MMLSQETRRRCMRSVLSVGKQTDISISFFEKRLVLMSLCADASQDASFFMKEQQKFRRKENMRTKSKRILCVIFAFVMLTCISTSATDADKTADSLAGWLSENIRVSDAEGIDSYLDWTVFAMARNGFTGYNTEYKAYIGNAVRENADSLYLNDYARISLAVMSVGMDATDIGGKSLIDSIEKTDFTKEAFTGSLAYALIALDSANSGNGGARKAIKDILIGAQREDGGFNSYVTADDASYWTVSGETDSTGIVLQALASYKDEEEVKKVIGKALDFIKKEQMDDGGFGAWGTGSAESTSMILAGLCAIGENPDKFIKNGKTIAEALPAYVNEDGGGKCWDGSSNIMTSYQMLMGLSAYDRFKSGKTGLFDMSCLSPECNSIEHIEFFAKHPKLGRIVCRIVTIIYRIIGKEYYCCKH